MDVKGKKVVVFGLARSGVGAAHLLLSLGAEVSVTDKKRGEELGEYAAQLPPSVTLCLGGHPESLDGTDMIVLSPGVPLDIAHLVKARERGIKIIGELELAYQVFRDKAHFLAVTGTNGKSTTTTLLDAMLRTGGFSTILGGNIGNALTEEIVRVRDGGNSLEEIDFIVAEVSSFQLESIDQFKPRGGAILNITPDHLDRYGSLGEYKEAKAAVFRNQDDRDFLVLNADDHETMDAAQKGLDRRDAKPQLFYFSRQSDVKGVYCREGVVYINLPDLPNSRPDTPLIHAGEIRIKGVHNLENAMAAAAMALLAGCPSEAVAETLREFPGLEHRLEFVRELNGVRYINDSKGTNVGAVLKSLDGFSEPVVLIAGGRDKAGDFSALAPLVKAKVKALVLIGEAAGKIGQALGGFTKAVLASDLGDAVSRARAAAEDGDVVLLSPACASFDMFRDFEDRGRQFKEIVRRLS